jgi:hypothetical chaperone protein
MKSVLGSSLMDGQTDIGGGKTRAYADVLADFMRHLKTCAEQQAGRETDAAVLGRPVFFVDDDPTRDAKAQTTLESVARKIGFKSVRFQLEPLAAAYDLEQTLEKETLCLIADFGGGTCDFSVVRLGGERKGKSERKADVLAHFGIHVAGTDFDRHVSLRSIMPLLGAGSRTPQGREVPSAAYHDLATWHLINTVYAPPRVRELAGMRAMYAETQKFERLMRAVSLRLGHELASAAERGKVDAAEHGQARIDLTRIETDLFGELGPRELEQALAHDLDRIAQAGLQCVKAAGVDSSAVQLVYFTGGSSRLKLLCDQVAKPFVNARRHHGDSFASVAKGLGVYAATLLV